MRHIALLDQLEFNDDRAHSEPLFVDSHARLLRFALRPGQSIAEHNAPNSPFYVVGVAGRGVFTDGDGESHMVLPNDLLVFDVGEKHSVAAGDEDFVFLGILLSAPQVRDGHIGGTMARPDSGDVQ